MRVSLLNVLGGLAVVVFLVALFALHGTVALVTAVGAALLLLVVLGVVLMKTRPGGGGADQVGGLPYRPFK